MEPNIFIDIRYKNVYIFGRREALFCLPQTCKVVFCFCFLYRTWSCTFLFYPSLAHYTLLLYVQDSSQSESSPSQRSTMQLSEDNVHAHWLFSPLISSSLYLLSQNPPRKKEGEVWHDLFHLIWYRSSQGTYVQWAFCSKSLLRFIRLLTMAVWWLFPDHTYSLCFQSIPWADGLCTRLPFLLPFSTSLISPSPPDRCW